MPAAHLRHPAPEREALAVDVVLAEARTAAGVDVLAHVAQPGLEEQVDRDPVAVVALQRQLVDVAPDPVLPGLKRAHHRVARVVVMPGRVAVRARVAAAAVPACHAAPEADPALLAHPSAVLADRLGDRLPVVADLLRVLASDGHAR